jgi:shikimate kinase
VIFLVGFMGCGKSSVGPALATLLGVDFVDLDELVSYDAGRSVRAIFEEEGEAAFRARERASLLALEPRLGAGAVVATGGGAWIDERSRGWMRAHGETIWLDATLDAIERRIQPDGTRPMYGDRAALEALFDERRPAYATAGLRVETSTQPPEETARIIALALRARMDGRA